jgi:hypothetical protein
LAKEELKMVVINNMAIHQHQNCHLEVQPDKKPINPGFFKHLVMSPTCRKAPCLHENIRNIPRFIKSSTVKQPAYLHFPTILSTFYSALAGEFERVTITNKREVLDPIY